jgi:chromate transporter
VAGACFIVPAVLITTLLAWVYVKWGSLPQLKPLLEGIKPAVVAIIFAAGWRLGKKALKSRQLVFLAMAAMAGAWLEFGQVTTLLIVSLLGMFWLRAIGKTSGSAAGMLLGLVGASKASVSQAATVSPWILSTGLIGWVTAGPSVARIGLFFLKVGAVLYGSGYVLFAYLEELVTHHEWLTRAELMDSVAIGQFTPGPILSTATFIGYVVMENSQPGSGFSGAIAATAGMFLPSFLFVALLGPLIPRLRTNATTSAFLDAVNAASIGLMAAVVLKLCLDVLLIWEVDVNVPIGIHWQSWPILLAACVAVFRYQVTAAWIVLGGALAGGLIAVL